MSKKKYVIESAFENVSVQKIMQLGLDANGRIINWTDSIEDVEELNSDYINEHYGELQDEAYRKGFEDGKKSVSEPDRIEVGDEVEWNGDCFIVTRIYQPLIDKRCNGIAKDGSVYMDVVYDRLTKTGRHFDIASILEAMRQ